MQFKSLDQFSIVSVIYIEPYFISRHLILLQLSSFTVVIDSIPSKNLLSKEGSYQKGKDMDKLLRMIFFGVLAVASMMQDATAQTVHMVGDGMGWIIPNNGAVAYTNWAAGKTFRVGDTLVFNFMTGRHDVQQVEKASFDGCNSQNAIGNPIMTGPATMTLNSTGDHYYICTFGNHCVSGQKLAITVSSSTSTPGANPPNPANPIVPSPSSSRQPEACAPTPSAAGPSNSVPGGPAPPSPSSSTTMLASFVLGLSAIALAIFL